MEEQYINPFEMGDSLYKEQAVPDTGISDTPKKQINLTNPFDKLVKKSSALDVPNINSTWKSQDTNTPVRVSTADSQEYIKRGFNINDLDLNPKLEQDLSSTQSRMDRLTNNLKVAGANLVSMAVVTGLSNPLSTGEDDLNGGIGKDLFDWSTGVARENRNFETANDESDNIWQQLTNWVNPLGNSTKGLGKLLESTAFGLGAGAGIAFQEAIVSFATEGIGTIPAFANNIKRVLNSAKYLDRALEASGMAVKGARNLERIVDTGLVSEKMSKALKNIYQSQVGAYSEALFEGLEGKESMKQQLLQDFKLNRGYDAIGKDLEDIEKASHELGVTRMNLNRALLSYSNISQFNSLFRTFNPIKETAEELAKKYGSKLLVQEGRVVVDEGKDLLKSAWFNKGVGKVLNKSLTGVYNASKEGVLKEALGEGKEEGVQFLIDKTLNNYYSWKFKGENKSFSDALVEGTKDLFTKEGMESIFTGALAGGGQSVAFNYLSKLNKDYKVNKEEFATNQKTLANQYNQFGKSFENLSNVTKKKIGTLFNHSSVNGTLHDKRTIMNASSGTSEIKNNPEDLEQYNQANMHELYSLALPYVQNGNVDILKEQFSKYKELDDDGFKKLFNVETTNKNKLVDYYLDEFDKIDKAFARTTTSFDLHFKGKDLTSLTSNQLYKEMKQELAFALYNNDNLIQDSKELEAKLVDYPKVINEYGLNFPKQISENKKQIKFLEKNLEITPEDTVTKDKIKGLQNHNSYLEKVMSGDKSISQSEYIRELNDNIIFPHFKSLGKETPEAFKQTEITNNILGTVYHLGKIKDRINYQQDKINKILYSNNPLEFFNNAQKEFESLVEKDKQSKIAKSTPVPDKEEVVEQEEELPVEETKEELSAIPNADEITKPEVVKTVEDNPIIDIVNTEGDVVGTDNLLSKIATIPFIIDKDGNILEDSQSFINRAKAVYSFLLNNSTDKYKDLSYKLIDVKDNEPFPYPVESSTLTRNTVKKVIGVFKNNVPIGSFYLDEDTLQVNLSVIGNLIGLGDTLAKNTNIPTNLYDFLQYLAKDTTGLFNKIKETNTLFKANKSLSDLISEHTLIKNTNDSIKTFVVDNKLDEQGLADFIKDNDLLESRLHIRPDKRDKDFIPLVGSTLEDEAIIVEVSPTNQFSYLTDIPNDSIKKEIKEAIKNLQKVDYPRRLLFYKQKRTSGKESWSHFNVPVSDARLFKEELTKTLSTLQDFKDRTRQLHYVLNDGVTNVDLNVYEKDDKSGMELVISLSKGQEEPYFYSDNIKIKEMSNEEFLNLIEDNLKTFKDVNDNTITKVKARRIEGKQSDTKISKSTILIPTYVTGIAPKGQVFTVSYLQLKPLNTALKSKELPSFLSEKDENIDKFNAKMTATPDKEKAQISEEKTVKDFNSAFGAIWDEDKNIKPNENYFTEISKPLESRRLQYTFYTSYSDKKTTKNGYKLTIPEFPNVEIYISNETVTDESVEGSTEFNLKSKEWKIDIKHPTKGFLSFPKPINAVTKKDVINSFVEDINKKYIKDLKNLKILEEVGIFLKQKVDVVKENNVIEELPLQVGQFYVDAGLPKIIESISYDGTTKDYIINNEPFKEFTINYFKKQQNSLKQKYEDSLQTQPTVSDEEILNQLEEESNLSEPEKPVILEEENKVDSLFKYLETIGVFPTEKLIELRNKKGDGETYNHLTNKLQLFIGKNSNEHNIVLSNVKSFGDKKLFEIKTPKLRVKEKVNKIDNQELYNKIKNCL